MGSRPDFGVYRKHLGIGYAYMPYRYEDPRRYDRQADLRQQADTSYTPMFISGGMQRGMGVQGAIGTPYGGYQHFGLGGFGGQVPVGNAFNGYGGGVQGRMAMPTEQTGPWSGFGGMTNYGSRPEFGTGNPDLNATQQLGTTGYARVRRGGLGGLVDRYKSVPISGWVNAEF